MWWSTWLQLRVEGHRNPQIYLLPRSDDCGGQEARRYDDLFPLIRRFCRGEAIVDGENRTGSAQEPHGFSELSFRRQPPHLHVWTNRVFEDHGELHDHDVGFPVHFHNQGTTTFAESRMGRRAYLKIINSARHGNDSVR